MCVLIFSVTSVWIIARPKKYRSKYYHKCVLVFMWSTGYACQIVTNLEFSRKKFEKFSTIKFHENPSNGDRVVRCGQRNIKQNEVALSCSYWSNNRCLSQFCERRLKWLTCQSRTVPRQLTNSNFRLFLFEKLFCFYCFQFGWKFRRISLYYDRVSQEATSSTRQIIYTPYTAM